MIFLLYFTALVLVFHVRHLRGEWMNFKIGEDGRRYFESRKIISARTQLFNVRTGIDCSKHLHFKIVPEKGMLRFLKKLGLVDEFQAGDNKIDKLLFISDDPAIFAEIMQKQIIRSALHTLQARHANIKIRAQDRRIWIEAKGVTADWLDTHRTEILAYLWEIAQAGENVAERYATTGPRFTYAQRASFFTIVHITLLSGGIYGVIGLSLDSIHVEKTAPLVIMGLSLIPLAVGVWISLMRTVMRRSMWLLVALGDFIVIGFAGLLLLLPLMAVEANQRLPQGPAARLEKKLLGKQCYLYCQWSYNRRRPGDQYHFTPQMCTAANLKPHLDALKEKNPRCQSDGTMYYLLKFEPWYSNETEPHIHRTSAALFEASTVGDSFAVPLYPGALGVRWFNEQELRPINTPQKAR